MIETMTYDDELSDAILCERARSLWLSCNNNCDTVMETVECLYRTVWLRNSSLSGSACENERDDKQDYKKQRLDVAAMNKEDDDSYQRQAGEKLALILLQSGRAKEGDKILATLGYTCRLASKVLNYATEGCVTPEVGENDNSPCGLYNDFLSHTELEMFQTVFLDPANSYWTEHCYTVEPPSPYFSYLLPLRRDDMSMAGCGIASFVQRLQKFLEPTFPVKNATYCEMWAHNRPHATGHQFHFDSDNEGCTETIRNPICSCVIYLTDGVGGPSLVTNQRLSSRTLATAGWMCPAATGRMVAFDGKVLHGVIPGKAEFNGTSERSSRRRVSVMFAFWRKIRVRDGTESTQGAALPFPSQPLWAQQLRKPLGSNQKILAPVAAKPIALDCVYENIVDGQPWSRKLGLPDYEQIYQGF